MFGFGLGFLVTRLVLAIRFPHPSKDQEAVFRTVLSLAAAGIAASIPGLMRFESQVAATTISATGALAVFALVYLLNPASPRKGLLNSDPGKTEPAPGGDVQPLQKSLDDLAAEMRTLASRVERLELCYPQAESSAPSLERAAGLRTQRVLLFVATATLIGSFLIYALAFTSVITVQISLLRVAFALLGAGVGALIPGTLSVATPGTRTILRAVAALALFIIIYFFAAVSMAAMVLSR